MKIFVLLIAIVAWFFPHDVYSQERALPRLTTEMVDDNGLLLFSSSDEWKYQPGDDMQWANPEFDDSGWYDISPGNLGIDEMPDSLWNGYGWWRFTFTADNSFYQKNWNLFFNSSGAAEVYLDGKLVHSFGNFSIYPDKEKTYNLPSFAILPLTDISESDTHTIAVRYSYHQAKRYNTIIKVNAGDLGFGFGFGTHAFNQNIVEFLTHQSFMNFFSAAVLFVLFLLHLMLFYKFPEDRSNLFISIVVGLLLIAIVATSSHVFSDVTSYWRSILIWVWLFSSAFAVIFLPYVTAEIFKLEKLKKVAWLTAGFPLIVIAWFFNKEIANYIALFLYSISFFLIGVICWQAYKSGKRGVQYVAFGALGTMGFVIIWMFSVLGLIEIPLQVFTVMIVCLWTLFPLGMTLYVAESYGYLFTSLESEITVRTKKLKQSLEQLRATQTQLIQQEKLASLGQLTAGIAHEIQNPLNFVNNFSEVSNELIAEIEEERSKSKDARDETLVSEILSDIKENLSKINHHGKRADAIVKGMLEHSRKSEGTKTPTNLNALADEYLRLSYHGLRAKDKSFNADFKTDFDPNLPKVEVIPQDIGRVLLNLINNAFYAVNEPSKGSEPLEGYKPIVTISTKNLGDRIEIAVSDNGPGIPDSIKEKIFQPFFTTKPTGQGTGLGLSLAYDIVKAHGGELKVETKEGEGSIFILQFPTS